MSHSFLNAAERLADVLAQENDALKRLDFSSAIALVPDKEAALTILKNQTMLGPLSLRTAILRQRLDRLLNDNQALLERAIALQTRIVQIIARAAIPPAAATGYGAYVPRGPSRRTVALALSTRA